jgi:hypothetical protein
MNHRQLAIDALIQLKSDNTERVRIEFRGLSAEDMAKEYCHMGKTRAEFLAECERYDAEIDAAIAWVKAVR